MCKNLLRAIFRPIEHRREMNAWKQEPPSTLTSILDEQFKLALELARLEAGSDQYLIVEARYAALQREYDETKKYRKQNGMLIV